MATMRNFKIIKATPEKLFRALTDPEALAVWQAPGEMSATVNNFHLRVGGGYTMSLFYPPSEKAFHDKTSEWKDGFTVRFIELTPPRRIVQVVTFDSVDPSFSGEMNMEITFEPKSIGTKVIVLFKNLPPGMRPEDNVAGTQSSLEKLARYVE